MYVQVGHTVPMSSRKMAGRTRTPQHSRRADLLSRIPRDALLDALAAYPTVHRAASARGAALNALVRNTLTRNELEKLQKTWRYGKRVSTALLLCSEPPQVSATTMAAAVQTALDAAAPPGQSDIERMMRIAIRDVTPFDTGLIEISFRYGHAFSLINLDEDEVTEHESRYGFIWIATREQFVAISGEESSSRSCVPPSRRHLVSPCCAAAWGSEPSSWSFRSTRRRRCPTSIR